MNSNRKSPVSGNLISQKQSVSSDRISRKPNGKDIEKEEFPAQMVQVSEAEIKRAQKAEKEEMLLKGLMRKRMKFLALN